MRSLGVGLVYWAALDAILRHDGAEISVLEIEPQTLWEQTYGSGGWQYSANEALFDRVASLPHSKLLHGVGQPLGGTVPDPIDPMPLLRDAVRRLAPAWISEHLSFNRVQRDGHVEHVGFLLPPPQTTAAVRVATRNIDRFRHSLGRPVAFETGVNYLRPNDSDISDGEFFSAVAEESNCGILLDLHNLWCNERNGRQSVAEVLARLPLDRVWEIHVAGGMEESGYWIDAHSGAVPSEVLDIAAQIIPRLPNLGALVFEILPEHLPGFGLARVEQQIEVLHDLWKLRPPAVRRAHKDAYLPSTRAADIAADRVEVGRRETELAELLRAGGGPAGESKASPVDPGVHLVRTLVADFRRATLARALRFTLTALLGGLGQRGAQDLLDAYLEAYPPEPFGAVEADRCASFLRTCLPRMPAIPFLEEVLSYEHALVKAAIYGTSSEVRWSADPVRILESLDHGELPGALPVVSSSMIVCVG
ncbi:MAG TPA: DUF692 family protein [Chloroflexota bacterium]